MNTPEDEDLLVLSFLKIAREISMNVKKTASSLALLEQAYENINNAMFDLPRAVDQDNVVGQGLMEGVLRLDMQVLLIEINQMKKALHDFIKVMTQSAMELFSDISMIIRCDGAGKTELNKAREEITGNIEILISLESRLI